MVIKHHLIETLKKLVTKTGTEVKYRNLSMRVDKNKDSNLKISFDSNCNRKRTERNRCYYSKKKRKHKIL